MAKDNVRILCQKYQWSSIVEVEDCNFFHSATPTKIHEFNLFNHLLEDTDLKLKYTFDVTEKSGKADNSLFYQAGRIDFRITEHKPINNQLASNYFEMFTDSRRFKWLITIFVNELPEWMGVINQNSIELYKHRDGDNNVISAVAVGLEKEFADYYSNKTLSQGIGITEPHDFQIRFYNTTIGQTQYVTPNWCPLFSVLHTNFGQSFLNYQLHTTQIGSWYINYDYPFLKADNGVHTSENTNYVWLKNSYLRNYDEGISRWDWFKILCNAMGWQFFFMFSGSQLFFSVIPRHRNTVMYDLNVPYNELKGWTATKFDNVKYDYVEVPSGLIYGGDEAFLVGNRDLNKEFKGNRVTLFNDKKNYVNKSDHFESITRFPNSITGSYEINANTGYKFQKYVANDNEDFYSVSEFTLTNTTSTSEATGVNKSVSLKVSSGENRRKYMKVDLGSGIHHYQEDNFAIGDNDLVFYGNSGHQCFQFTEFPNKFFTYDDYVRTDDYKNCFIKFLNNRNNVSLALIYEKLVTNPIINVKVDNYPSEPFNNSGRIYAVSEMTSDLINDMTEFSVFQIH